MNENILNSIIDKFELLIKINNLSPLLVTMAYKKFLDRELDNALQILEDSLSKFNDHPTALILKAKILEKKGNPSSALNLIKKVSLILGSNKIFDHYLTEFGIFNTTDVYLSTTNQSTSLFSDATDKSQNIEISHSTSNQIENKDQSTISAPTSIEKIDDSLIISDTLAKIYFNQKEYREALRIYTKLKDLHPGKLDFYESKISEIKSLLNNL